ncbi:hypothetical protein YH64_009325 [Achromobacter sp. LC458]|uniref:hypothetical protein n=1 Tax=Achromobacter sp. LC458 TaxID=1120623 RepID=UPI00062A0C0C|nr:hypothetical protein [Achromobacter sp. LC458]TRM53289.1 hypothetical protein YH64_009325 [Achromobacter sp. LC458]
MSKRTHNVQTPGDVPQATQGDQPEDSTTPVVDTPDQTPSTPTEPQATEPAKLKAAKAPKTRAEYATTPAADVDPSTITAPVLSRDGWVIPLPKA